MARATRLGSGLGLRPPGNGQYGMTTVIYFINQAMEMVFSVVLWPFHRLAPIWGLTFVSVLTGIFMVWVFGRVSNQQGISLVRDRIRGNLLGVRLYQHDVPVVLGLQGRILRDTFTYMNHSLVPMLVLLIPMLLVLVQLNYSFGFRPLAPGEVSLLKATFSDPAVVGKELRLEAPDGIEVETPALRIPVASEAAWRIRVKAPGSHSLKLWVGDESFEKRIQVGESWGPISPLRSTHLTDVLLYHGEEPLPSSVQVSSLELVYPPLSIQFLAWEVDWLVFFFVASMVAAFAFKGPMGVEL